MIILQAWFSLYEVLEKMSLKNSTDDLNLEKVAYHMDWMIEKLNFGIRDDIRVNIIKTIYTAELGNDIEFIIW